MINKEVKEGTSIIRGNTSKKKVSYRGPTADHKRDKDGNIESSYYGKKEKSKKHADAVRKFDNYKKLQAEISAREDARKKHNQEYAARKKVGKSEMTEKYGDTFDTPKQKVKDSAREKENTDSNLRMKHGKKWRDFTKDALAAKDKERNRLRPGEVKKLVNGKWVSNKD